MFNHANKAYILENCFKLFVIEKQANINMCIQ